MIMTGRPGTYQSMTSHGVVGADSVPSGGYLRRVSCAPWCAVGDGHPGRRPEQSSGACPASLGMPFSAWRVNRCWKRSRCESRARPHGCLWAESSATLTTDEARRWLQAALDVCDLVDGYDNAERLA